MTFLGSVNFVEGRTASKTTALVLQECLGCGKQDEGKAVSKFLATLKIKPDAFFADIDGDWSGRPFLGQHVFKVVQAAGYEGTEHDLWNTVTGDIAPYPVKISKAVRAKEAKARSKVSAALKAQGDAKKAARHAAIKTAWEAVTAPKAGRRKVKK